MARFDRSELMQAYARALQTEVSSTGKLMTGSLIVPLAIVADTIESVMCFLEISLKNHKFVPICLGNPGSPDDVIKSLETNGCWVGHDIPNREMVARCILTAKQECNPRPKTELLFL